MFVPMLAVTGLFILRIGIPLLALIIIGTLVERAYRSRTT